MGKRTHPKTPLKTRRSLPQVKDGILYCPFCFPSHPLDPSKVAACGTHIEVHAVQEIIRAKLVNDLKCIKCGQGGGEMVRFQNAYIHTHDCTPGKTVITEEPQYSRLAKVIYNFPDFLKRPLEKRLGRASPVEEIDTSGAKTGEVLGYFFYKSGA